MAGPDLPALLAGSGVVSRRGWAGASVVIGLEVAAITAGVLGLHLLAALVMAALLLALMAAGGTCLALTVSLAVGRGERRDLEAQLVEATAEYDRLVDRNRELGDDLSRARLDADTARDELARRGLPQRSPGARDRALDSWADLNISARVDWDAELRHITGGTP